MPTSTPPSAAVRRTVHVEHVMGTTVSFAMRRDGDHDAAVAAASAWFHLVDRRFSTWREDSEVRRFARGDLRGDSLSADLRDLTSLQESGGGGH